MTTAIMTKKEFKIAERNIYTTDGVPCGVHEDWMCDGIWYEHCVRNNPVDHLETHEETKCIAPIEYFIEFYERYIKADEKNLISDYERAVYVDAIKMIRNFLCQELDVKAS